MVNKKEFVKDLQGGQEVDSAFLVISQTRGLTNRGAAYLNVELGDKSGRIQAKVWDEVEIFGPLLVAGAVARVEGRVDSYRGSLQFIIRQVQPVPEEEFDWGDFIKASARPEARMKSDLWDLINSVSDADYRRLLTAALSRPEVAGLFYSMPAAKNLHHAYLHGLLEHSLSVGQMARMAAAHYPKLNASLLIAGGVLHDLGKIWEFLPLPQSDYSTIGRLKGHLVMGCEYLGRVAGELAGFPLQKLELLQHLILSHHGEPEFGAPVRPQILEAIVLHHLDNIDAKIEAIDSFLESATDESGWSAYHRLFGSYYLRTPEFEPQIEETPEPEKPIESQELENVESSDGEDGDKAEEPSSEGRLF